MHPKSEKERHAVHDERERERKSKERRATGDKRKLWRSKACS